MTRPLRDRFWEMKFGLQRSFYYYEARLLFWCGITVFLSIVETAVAILCLFEVLPGNWRAAIGMVVLLVGTTLQGNRRIKTLRGQKKAMAKCLSKIPYRENDATEKIYRKVKEEREKAELADDVLFETLDAMCHNKACMTLGVPERYPISTMRAFWGWWLPLPYPNNFQSKNNQQKRETNV